MAERLASILGFTTYPVRLFVDPLHESVQGYWQYDTETVGLALGVIQRHDLSGMIGILLHEYTHANGGHDDNCREFENDLNDVISMLGMELLSAKEPKIGIKYGISKG